MWKWIIGGIVLFIAFIAWRGFARYKEFTAGGNSAIVSIAATPARVFASLANADSLSSWMVRNGTVRAPREGALQVGDEIFVEPASRRSSRSASFNWTVTEIRPGQLLTMEMRTDTLGTLAARRDSLVAFGDSTRIISTLTSPMLESIGRAKGDTASAARSAVVGFSSKLMLAAFRVEIEVELRRLKERIEGAPRKPVERENK